MATVTKKRRAKTGRADGSINKAEEIRNAAKAMGGKTVRPKDVIAALADKGITVSSPQVSATLKAAGYRRIRRKGRPAGASGRGKSAAHSDSSGLSLEHLLAAKALIAKIGSVEAAKRALDVLAKLA
jgi:hypothetical protein